MSRAVALSVACHVLLLWLLLGPLPHQLRRAIDVAILDHPSAAPPSGPPAGDPTPPPRARPHRRGHAQPIAVVPAPSALPLPVAAEPSTSELGSDDDEDGDDDGAGGGIASGVAAAPAPEPDRSRAPDFDEDSCIHGVDYPWKAKLLDKEGVVHLRVTLDADGRVVAATVTQKAGYGFDETARAAVLARCRFTPALDRHGRPTPYVIDDYRYHFRFADFFHDQPWGPPRHSLMTR